MNSSCKVIKIKICFVSLQLFPFISGELKKEFIGGAELQQAMLAKLLKKNGFSVSVISMDYGQNDAASYNEINIHKTFKETEGLPGIRFFYPRLYCIWKAMKVANADVYYVRCAGYLTAVVASFCKLYRKKSIFAAGHDTDFIPGEFLIAHFRDKWLHKIGLSKVSTVIVQSKQQKDLLFKNFNRTGHIIRNFSINEPKYVSAESRQIILWVATIREWKRPELFLELAKRNPGKYFVMVGGPDSANIKLFKDIQGKAGDISNLEFKGFQPIEITEKYFDQCQVFVNTSFQEGFPNTFIQAWRRGIPVLSFFDPDNLIEEHQLGFVAKSETEFYTSLESVSKTGFSRSKHIINYFKDNHSDAIINKYLMLFKSLSLIT